MKLADQLTKLRKSHDYTQEDIAKKLNISKQAISKWESGRGYPDMDNLVILSELYSVTLDELIKGDEMFQKKIKVDPKDDQNVAIMIAILIVGLAIFYIVNQGVVLIFTIIIGVVAPFFIKVIENWLKRK